MKPDQPIDRSPDQFNRSPDPITRSPDHPIRSADQQINRSHHSPFLSIWLSPRAAIRRIVTIDPRRHTWMLMSVATFFAVLDLLATPVPIEPVQPIAAYAPLGPWGSLLVAAVLAPLGIPSLPPLAVVYRWVSGWFRGTAARDEMAAVIAWSAWPLIVTWCVSWIARLLMSGGVMFTSVPEPTDLQWNVDVALLVLQIASVAVSVVILAAGVAEVSGFGLIESIATNVLATLIVLVPLLIIAVIGAAVLVAALLSNM